MRTARLCAILTVLLLSMWLGGAAHAKEIHHIFVLDQSGSMEPFFNHPEGRLIRFLEEILRPGFLLSDQDTVSVLLFSEPKAAVASPQVSFRGTAAELKQSWPSVAKRLTAIQQWTDLIHGMEVGVQEAVSSSATTRLVWFLTDNVNELNDERDRQTTRDFYVALKEKVEFQGLSHIQVFPLDLQHPTEKVGLMLYGMLWAQDEAVAGGPSPQVIEYHRVMSKLAQSNREEFFGQPPLPVKPIDGRSMKLELLEFTPHGGTPVPVEIVNGVVELPKGIYREGEPIQGTLRGRLASTFDIFRVPQVRLTANLSDPRTRDFSPVKPGLQRIEPDHIGDIGAGSHSEPFDIKIELPPLQANWSMQSVLLSTSGTVESDVRLIPSVADNRGLDIDLSRISHLRFHAMTDLPKLFAQEVKVLPVEATLRIPVSYSSQRFLWGIVSIAIGLIVLTALLIGLWRLLSYREWWVLVLPDGSETLLGFGYLFPRRHEVAWEGFYLGRLSREAQCRLRFRAADVDDVITVDDGESFRAEREGKIFWFHVHRQSSLIETEVEENAL